jgi:hypothetical protein
MQPGKAVSVAQQSAQQEQHSPSIGNLMCTMHAVDCVSSAEWLLYMGNIKAAASVCLLVCLVD